MEELSEAPTVIMYMLAITLVIIIGMTLAVFAYDGVGIVKKWNNICMLEVGKEYAKYGFTYYVPVDMQPGEYIDNQKYMAFIRPDYNNELKPPKDSQHYVSGYYKAYTWAKPGEVNLIDSSRTNLPYPSSSILTFPIAGNDGYYPTPPKGSISLAYLLRENYDEYDEAEALYIASIVPLKTTIDGNTSYSTIPTKNIVFVKFYPSNDFGVANMMRLGVIQIGRNPDLDYMSKLYLPCYHSNIGFDSYNLITWWGTEQNIFGDPTPVEIYSQR